MTTQTSLPDLDDDAISLTASSGSIGAHCSSVNSAIRFYAMQEFQRNHAFRQEPQLETESIYETASKSAT
jgi:hypothetical protein